MQKRFLTSKMCTATRSMLPTLLCASESPTELVRKKDIQEKWVHITKSREDPDTWATETLHSFIR